MLSEEEIRLKLGLDTKEIDEGTRRAMQKIVAFGQESKKAFYEHGEKPARAFHKALHEISEQMPILGRAATIALSPIGGVLAGAAAAAAYFRDMLKDVNDRLDRIGRSNALPIGNVRRAERAAGRGNQADRIRAELETDQLEDPLGEKIRGARTQSQRESVLVEILQRRRELENRVTDYNSKFGGRDRSRLQISKADENLKSLSGQLSSSQSELPKLEELEKKAKANAAMGNSQPVLGPFGWVTPQAQASQAEADAESMRLKITNLKKAIDSEADKREDLAANLDEDSRKHQADVVQLGKVMEARKSLEDSMRNQEALQKAYNSQIAIALRNKSEIQAAPFTPGLQELAGYNGPYSYIAREVMAARDAAKRQAGFANPGDLQGLSASVRGYQYDLGNEFRGATTYEGRQAALRKYAERMQGLVSGRITPEHQLEVIADQMKSLNEKATTQGLVVRGTEQ